MTGAWEVHAHNARGRKSKRLHFLFLPVQLQSCFYDAKGMFLMCFLCVCKGSKILSSLSVAILLSVTLDSVLSCRSCELLFLD